MSTRCLSSVHAIDLFAPTDIVYFIFNHSQGSNMCDVTYVASYVIAKRARLPKLPSYKPTPYPTSTNAPSRAPHTAAPNEKKTNRPVLDWSMFTDAPTSQPTVEESSIATTDQPTALQSSAPTQSDTSTASTSQPTLFPTHTPSSDSTMVPSSTPTPSPTRQSPTVSPSRKPAPSTRPTVSPTVKNRRIGPFGRN